MFTQCPKCQSVFMVSEKDIKAHEGLVRCGNCYSVFNSSWNLTDDPRSEIGNNSSRGPVSIKAGEPRSGFTFSIVSNDTDSTPQQDGLVGRASDVPVRPENQDDNEILDHHMSDDHLEPFPEPEEEEDQQSDTQEIKVQEIHHSLLYFGSDDEDNAAEENLDFDTAEDTAFLQMPSLTAEPTEIELDDPFLEPDINKDESPLMSMTEESMWPGSEVNFEDIDKDFDLPELDVKVSESEAHIPESVDTFPDLADFSIDRPVAEDGLVEGLDDPLLFNEPAEELLLDEEEKLTDTVKDPFEQLLPSLYNKDAKEDFKLPDADDMQQITGDASDSENVARDEGEKLFIGPLLESDDDSFQADIDEEDTFSESVFITSEEDEMDVAYVPISVKSEERDELFHDLDDFPEPGELSRLNYEDTMEINAMLEAASISKAQIDTAFSSSENGGNDDEDIEEIMLSSDAGIDLEDALFFSGKEGSDADSGNISGSDKDSKSGVSFFRRLLPLRMGDKEALEEPSALNAEETQLIQSLHRRKNKTAPPEWVSKYSLIVVAGLLIATLAGQIGYFYMDKLIGITPIKPLLEAGCKVAGCVVPQIQNTEKIEQLSSRLSPLAGSDGGFKVDSILVNRDIRSQAFPALELTLTDRSGNMISRRVVTPDMYLPEAHSPVIKPNEAVDISLRFRTASIRVDGFELRPVSQNWLDRSR